jgi:hypothetical protein
MSVLEARRQALIAAKARAMGIEPWTLEMAMADGGVMRDVLADARRPNPVTSGPTSMASPGPETDWERVKADRAWKDRMAAEFEARQRPRSSGWVEAQPLGDWRPPGQRYVEAQLDAADARDRAELKAKFARGPK